jgi:putative flippase GtrA
MCWYKADVALFLGFSAVGAVGTAAHYAALIILVEVLDLNAILSSGIGGAIGALMNYYLNYRLVFRSNKRHVEALGKFMATAGIALTLNIALIALFTHLLVLHYIYAQLVTTSAVLFFNFTINRYWTFG